MTPEQIFKAAKLLKARDEVREGRAFLSKAEPRVVVSFGDHDTLNAQIRVPRALATALLNQVSESVEADLKKLGVK